MSPLTPGPLERAARALGEMATRDAPLGSLTTYRVGGPAAILVRARAVEDLLRVGRVLNETGLPVLVLGKGSNLLVSDAGFPGVVVALDETLSQVSVGEEVTAGGGAALPVLARQSAAAGRRGLEWAVGVPGSVGGGVRMNAGGHGSDMAQCLLSCRLVDLRSGRELTLAVSEMGFGYRRSVVQAHQVVLEATFRSQPGSRQEAEAQISEIVRWRRENQPGGQNAGSVFTNPPGDSAGRLIDGAGLKGLRIGSAEVSFKHANFIQADPGGSAEDVRELIERVRRAVEEHSGVRLETEVRLVGFGRRPGDEARGDSQ